MSILHVKDVVKLAVGQMINTCRHERIKLDITLGIFRGGEPILPVGNQKRREDRCLHHRLSIYGLDADISEVTDFQRLDEIGFVDVVATLFQLFTQSI